ncbi:MAG: hypothetical protein K5643_03420 [Saccharofermentans sp.]|nr:hypothetical protein [Saccharofermentans sp.]
MTEVKDKKKQRIKGIAVIAIIVIIFGLMALAAFHVTVTVFGPLFS